MMAYRACEHKSTGTSSNKMMLGRETATPLDLVFQMQSPIKPMPSNKWVWELQENLENTHKFVRQYTGRSINRQKHYHDTKLPLEFLLFETRCVYTFQLERSEHHQNLLHNGKVLSKFMKNFQMYCLK